MDRQSGAFSLPKLGIGVALVLLGLVMPLLVNVDNLGVYSTLFMALERQDTVLVLYAAIRLVALNTLRCIPHYLGAFFIGESINTGKGIQFRQGVKVVLILAIIPLVYRAIEGLYGIHYDFGAPAILLIFMIVMLEKADFTTINVAKKALMVVLLISSMQFLDVMPGLSRFPFGRGEASNDIKMAASLLDAEEALQFTGVLLFGLLLLGSLLTLKLILDENRLRQYGEQQGYLERERGKERLRALEQRSLLEMRHLVHDLKSPLTAAQALISVVKLDQPEESQNAAYLSTAEYALEHMSAMISEILYEDYARPTDTRHIVDGLLAQLSDPAYGQVLRVDNLAPDAWVEVNEIRLVRALANLVENAKKALPPAGGQVVLQISRVERDGQGCVRFLVEDNGCGISQEKMHDIWTQGFSGNGSSGLGLGFVRQVVEQNHGTIHIDSQVGRGTAVSMVFTESGEEDE